MMMRQKDDDFRTQLLFFLPSTGEDKVIRFSGCKENQACTIVLRGASTHVLDEAERSLHDALAVLFQTVSQVGLRF